MDADTARLIQAVQAVIAGERPEHVRQALCEVLGVMTAHVMEGLPEAEREAMLQATLDIIADEVTTGYREFVAWSERKTS